MSFVVRAAGPEDLTAIYQIAKSTGGGFTNLPPDRPTLSTRLARTAEAFERDDEEMRDDLFFFVLEDTATQEVRGTCLIFSQIGSTWPFYSYRIATVSSYSKEMQRTFRYETLTLTTDLDGSSEVGGLFLHPGERAVGVGALLALREAAARKEGVGAAPDGVAGTVPVTEPALAVALGRGVAE
jgi:arginine N-succinyltransferase